MKNEVEDLRRKATDLEKKCEQLEESLKKSEERFHKIFHASSNAMAISTLSDGRLIDLNEASAALGGYTREESIGSRDAERNLWADLKQRDMVIRKMQEEGSVHNMAVDLRSRTGEIRKVLFSADPLVVNGEPALLSVSVDITAREKAADALRASEEKYRMLVENSLQGLTIVQDGASSSATAPSPAIQGTPSMNCWLSLI